MKYYLILLLYNKSRYKTIMGRDSITLNNLLLELWITNITIKFHSFLRNLRYFHFVVSVVHRTVRFLSSNHPYLLLFIFSIWFSCITRIECFGGGRGNVTSGKSKILRHRLNFILTRFWKLLGTPLFSSRNLRKIFCYAE